MKDYNVNSEQLTDPTGKYKVDFTEIENDDSVNIYGYIKNIYDDTEENLINTEFIALNPLSTVYNNKYKYIYEIPDEDYDKFKLIQANDEIYKYYSSKTTANGTSIDDIEVLFVGNSDDNNVEEVLSMSNAEENSIEDEKAFDNIRELDYISNDDVTLTFNVDISEYGNYLSTWNSTCYINGMSTQFYSTTIINNTLTLSIRKSSYYNNVGSSIDYVTLVLKNPATFDTLVFKYSFFGDVIDPYISYTPMTDTYGDININLRYDISIAGEYETSDITTNLATSSENTIEYLEFNLSTININKYNSQDLLIANTSNDYYYGISINSLNATYDTFTTQLIEDSSDDYIQIDNLILIKPGGYITIRFSTDVEDKNSSTSYSLSFNSYYQDYPTEDSGYVEPVRIVKAETIVRVTIVDYDTTGILSSNRLSLTLYDEENSEQLCLSNVDLPSTSINTDSEEYFTSFNMIFIDFAVITVQNLLSVYYNGTLVCNETNSTDHDNLIDGYNSNCGLANVILIPEDIYNQYTTFISSTDRDTDDPDYYFFTAMKNFAEENNYTYVRQLDLTFETRTMDEYNDEYIELPSSTVLYIDYTKREFSLDTNHNGILGDITNDSRIEKSINITVRDRSSTVVTADMVEIVQEQLTGVNISVEFVDVYLYPTVYGKKDDESIEITGMDRIDTLELDGFNYVSITNKNVNPVLIQLDSLLYVKPSEDDMGENLDGEVFNSAGYEFLQVNIVSVLDDDTYVSTITDVTTYLNYSYDNNTGYTLITDEEDYLNNTAVQISKTLSGYVLEPGDKLLLQVIVPLSTNTNTNYKALPDYIPTANESERFVHATYNVTAIPLTTKSFNQQGNTDYIANYTLISDVVSNDDDAYSLNSAEGTGSIYVYPSLSIDGINNYTDTVRNVLTNNIVSRDLCIVPILVSEEDTFSAGQNDNYFDYLESSEDVENTFLGGNQVQYYEDSNYIYLTDINPYTFDDLVFLESGLNINYSDIIDIFLNNYQFDDDDDDSLELEDIYGIYLISRIVYEDGTIGYNTAKIVNQIVVTRNSDEDLPKLNRLNGSCFHIIKIQNKSYDFDYKIVVDDKEVEEYSVISNKNEIALHKFRLYYRTKDTEDEWALIDSFEGCIDCTKPLVPFLYKINNETIDGETINTRYRVNRYDDFFKTDLLNVFGDNTNNIIQLRSENDIYQNNNLYQSNYDEVTDDLDFVTITHKVYEDSPNVIIGKNISDTITIKNTSSNSIVNVEVYYPSYLKLTDNYNSSSCIAVDNYEKIYQLTKDNNLSLKFNLRSNKTISNINEGDEIIIKIQDNYGTSNVTDNGWNEFILNVKGISAFGEYYNTDAISELLSYDFYTSEKVDDEIEYIQKDSFPDQDITEVFDLDNFNRNYFYRTVLYLDDKLIFDTNENRTHILISSSKLKYYLHSGTHDILITTYKFNGLSSSSKYHLTCIEDKIYYNTDDEEDSNYTTSIMDVDDPSRSILIPRLDSNDDFNYEDELVMSTLGDVGIVQKDSDGNFYFHNITNSISNYMKISKYIIHENEYLYESLKQDFQNYKNYLNSIAERFELLNELSGDTDSEMNTIYNRITTKFVLFDEVIEQASEENEDDEDSTTSESSTFPISGVIEDNILFSAKTTNMNYISTDYEADEENNIGITIQIPIIVANVDVTDSAQRQFLDEYLVMNNDIKNKYIQTVFIVNLYNIDDKTNSLNLNSYSSSNFTVISTTSENSGNITIVESSSDTDSDDTDAFSDYGSDFSFKKFYLNCSFSGEGDIYNTIGIKLNNKTYQFNINLIDLLSKFEYDMSDIITFITRCPYKEFVNNSDFDMEIKLYNTQTVLAYVNEKVTNVTRKIDINNYTQSFKCYAENMKIIKQPSSIYHNNSTSNSSTTITYNNLNSNTNEVPLCESYLLQSHSKGRIYFKNNVSILTSNETNKAAISTSAIRYIISLVKKPTVLTHMADGGSTHTLFYKGSFYFTEVNTKSIIIGDSDTNTAAKKSYFKYVLTDSTNNYFYYKPIAYDGFLMSELVDIKNNKINTNKDISIYPTFSKNGSNFGEVSAVGGGLTLPNSISSTTNKTLCIYNDLPEYKFFIEGYTVQGITPSVEFVGEETDYSVGDNYFNISIKDDGTSTLDVYHCYIFKFSANVSGSDHVFSDYDEISLHISVFENDDTDYYSRMIESECLLIDDNANTLNKLDSNNSSSTGNYKNIDTRLTAVTNYAITREPLFEGTTNININICKIEGKISSSRMSFSYDYSLLPNINHSYEFNLYEIYYPSRIDNTTTFIQFFNTSYIDGTLMPLISNNNFYINYTTLPIYRINTSSGSLWSTSVSTEYCYYLNYFFTADNNAAYSSGLKNIIDKFLTSYYNLNDDDSNKYYDLETLTRRNPFWMLFVINGADASYLEISLENLSYSVSEYNSNNRFLSKINDYGYNEIKIKNIPYLSCINEPINSNIKNVKLTLEFVPFDKFTDLIDFGFLTSLTNFFSINYDNYYNRSITYTSTFKYYTDDSTSPSYLFTDAISRAIDIFNLFKDKNYFIVDSALSDYLIKAKNNLEYIEGINKKLSFIEFNLRKVDAILDTKLDVYDYRSWINRNSNILGNLEYRINELLTDAYSNVEFTPTIGTYSDGSGEITVGELDSSNNLVDLTFTQNSNNIAVTSGNIYVKKNSMLSTEEFSSDDEFLTKETLIDKMTKYKGYTLDFCPSGISSYTTGSSNENYMSDITSNFVNYNIEKIHLSNTVSTNDENENKAYLEEVRHLNIERNNFLNAEFLRMGLMSVDNNISASTLFDSNDEDSDNETGSYSYEIT